MPVRRPTGTSAVESQNAAIVETTVAPSIPAVIRHEHVSLDPSVTERVKITLTRGQQGRYGWEVATEARTVTEVVRLLQEADAQLRASFSTAEQTT